MAADDATVVVTLRAELKGYESALKAAVRSTERAAKAAEDALGNVGKKKPFGSVNDNFQKSAAQITNDAKVMQYQLNDIFSGLASGQGIRAVQQQLGQIAQGMTGQTLVQGAKTMASALAGMVSPINLAVVGFGLLATVAANYFGESTEDAKAAAKAVEDYAETIKKLNAAFTAAGADSSFIDKLETYAKAAAAASAASVQLSDKARELQSSFLSGGRAKSNLTGMDPKDIEDIARAIKAIEIGDLERAAAILTNLSINADLPKDVQATVDGLLALAVEALKAGRAADELKIALASATKTIAGMTGGLAALAAAFSGAFGTATLGAVEAVIAKMGGVDKAIAAIKSTIGDLADSVTTTWTSFGEDMKTAADIIKKEEGFITNAKWDTNHFRVGFGSDTFVDEMGKVQEVTKDTVVTVAQAEQDLARRIGEFQGTIASQLGPEIWKGMAENQKAALTSIAYNYGNLPDSIVKAIKAGDQGQVALAIRSLSANPQRREREAKLYAGDSFAAGDALKAADDTAKANKALADYLVTLDEEATLKQRIADIETSGLSADEKTRAIAVETELQKALNQARQEGLTLTEEQIANIRRAAIAQADAKIQVDNFKESTKASEQAAKQFNQQMTQMASSAITGFISDLRNGVDAGEAFNNMLNKIIDSMIQMAVQMAVSSAFKGFGGGGLFGVPAAASGGIVGQSISGRRNVSPAVFAGAPRFASGGLVGLRPGEVPIIAHQGEMVIPKNMVGRGGKSTVSNTYSMDNARIAIDMANTGLVGADRDSTKQFGENVQKLIQAEMVRQSRPGGLLRKVPS